jgi:hypothetical protein
VRGSRSRRAFVLAVVGAGLAFGPAATGTAYAGCPVTRVLCDVLTVQNPVGEGGCTASVGKCEPDGHCVVNVGYCADNGQCVVNVGYCSDATPVRL